MRIKGKVPLRCSECTVWVEKQSERFQRLRALLRASMDNEEKAAAVVASARYENYSFAAFLSVSFALFGWDESIGTLCFITSHSDVILGSTIGLKFYAGRIWVMEIYQGIGWPDPRIHFGVRV